MESRTAPDEQVRSDSVCQDLQIYSSNRKSQSGTLVLFFFWIQKSTQTKTKRDELPAKQL